MKLRNLRMFAVALGLVAAQGCKSDTARKSDKAAENVVEKRTDLDREMSGTQNTRSIDRKTNELTRANDRFEVRKEIRIAGLRAEHDVLAAQPTLITSLAQAFPLTPAGRTDVTAKIDAFKTQLDDVGKRIEDLDATTADDWKARDQAMTDALAKLEDARSAAWQSLQNAPRTPRSS